MRSLRLRDQGRSRSALPSRPSTPTSARRSSFPCRESLLDVDAELLLRQVHDVADGRADSIAPAEIFADRLRFRGRLDDDERAAFTRLRPDCLFAVLVDHRGLFPTRRLLGCLWGALRDDGLGSPLLGK